MEFDEGFTSAVSRPSNAVVTIRLMTGSQRVLRLSAAAAPLVGVVTGIEQRGSVRWYPQNHTATAHNLGPTEKPTTLEFSWTLPRIRGNATLGGQPIQTTSGLVDTLKSMVAEGVLASVLIKHRENIARLASVEATEGRYEEAEVELELEWIKVAGTDHLRTPMPNLGSTANQIRQVWGRVLSTARYPFSAAKSFVDQAATFIGLVNESIRRVDSIAASARSSVRSIDRLTGGVAAALTGVVDRAQTTAAWFDQPAAQLAQMDDAEHILRAADMRAKLQRAAARIKRRAALDREAYLLAADPAVLGVHVAIEDENLRLVAARWYGGDAGAWTTIARYNQLTGSRLSAGQRVVIPHPRAR
ncbi:MAG: hypothetical protein ABIL09_11110 [Gemmatimonadota bacterium]